MGAFESIQWQGNNISALDSFVRSIITIIWRYLLVILLWGQGQIVDYL